MTDFEKKIENYHLKFYGKVDSEKFIENLHQRVQDNKINEYSRYLLSLFLIAFILLNVIESTNPENFDRDLQSNFYTKSTFEEYSDSTSIDSLYILDLEETFFTMGEIWNVLEFLDEIKIEEENQYENYN